MKNVMQTNLFIKVVFTLCVTAAAIYFGKAGVLWWYVLLPFIGYEYKSSSENKKATDCGTETDGEEDAEQ